MSTTIKVLSDDNFRVDVRQLSTEEREIIFAQLAEETPNIPRAVFEQFLDGYNEELFNSLRGEMPDLPELLLKQIINISCMTTNSRVNATSINTPNMAIPIVSNVVYGGEVPILKRALKPKYATPDLAPGIRVRFDRSITVSNENGKIFNTAPGDDISVIGLRIGVPAGRIVRYARDPTYKNVRGMLPLGTYRAEDIYDDVVSSGKSASIKAIFSQNIAPTSQVIFQGDAKKQLVDIFNQFVKYIYMPTSFGTFAHTLIGAAVKELPVNGLGSDNMGSVNSDTASSDTMGTSTNTTTQLARLLHPFRVVAKVPLNEIPASDDPVLVLLNSLGVGKFSDIFRLAVTTGVYGRGLASVYNGAITAGIDAGVVRSRLIIYSADKARRKFAQKVIHDRAEKELTNSTYRNIVLTLLGVARSNEIASRAKDDPLTYQTEGILPFLKPNEKKLVELEYQKQQEYTSAVIGNKCPHVAIYRRLRRSTDTISANKYLFELRKYYSRTGDARGNKGKSSSGFGQFAGGTGMGMGMSMGMSTHISNCTSTHNSDYSGGAGKHVHTHTHPLAMIKCNNCGFNLICPHYDEYISLSAESDRTIKIKMSKYLATGNTDQEKDSFCRICGEILSSIDALEGTTDEIPEHMDEEIRNFIWSEVAINMKFFRFGPMVDVSKLISRVRDGIYTPIFNIEKQILRSKTATADEIKARKKLFVTIYSFAYMVHLIMSNLGKDIIGMQNFKVTDPKKAIPELIKKSLELIMMSRSIIIKEISGISIDIIRNSLVSAYKEISNEGQLAITSETVEDRQIDLDPVFAAAVNMNVLSALTSHGGKFNREKIETALQNKILENFSKKKQIPTEGKTKGMFAEILNKLHWDTSTFMALVDNTDVRPEKNHLHSQRVKNRPEKNSPQSRDTKNHPQSQNSHDNSELTGYIAESYNIVVHYIKEKLFNYYAAASPEAYNIGLQELNERLERVRACESVFLRQKAMKYPHVHTQLTQSSHKFSDPGLSIARIYDESGIKHVWNIFVYESTRGESTRSGDTRPESTKYIQELRASDIAKIVTGGKRFDLRPIDVKCSICGILHSQVDQLDVQKIEESLRSAATLDNFFRYYETRCPKGDLHIFAADESTVGATSATSAVGVGSKCTKCGMTSGATAQTPGAMSIFRQHKSAYLADRDEINSGVVIAAAITRKPTVNPYADEYSTFAANFSVVTTLADVLKVNQKLILALGATEKIEYNDIVTGKYIPREVEERNAPRIYALDSYVRSLHIEWNQLRTFHRFQRPGSDIARLLESSGVPRHEVATAVAALPDVYDDYSLRFEYVRWHLKPRDIVAFCIQSFCERALKIRQYEGIGAPIAHAFAEYIVKKFLRNDELFSKPGYFSWSAVFGDKESKRDAAADDEEPNDNPVDTTDDMNEGAMSLEAYDVEEDPNAEPDDDPANQVRAGENYGLD